MLCSAGAPLRTAFPATHTHRGNSMRSLRRYYVIRRGRNYAVLDATTGAVAEMHLTRIDAVRRSLALNG